MRLRSWVVLMTALLAATTAAAGTSYPPRTGGNYDGPRWYGYFANNDHVAENADHTNITEVWSTYFENPYPSDPANDPARAAVITNATHHILDGLADAAKYGEKAMVAVDSIVLIPTGDNSAICYRNNPNAVADFQNLVNTLISYGYLVPNAPDFGTVSSFYVADEPELNCLNDDGIRGAPNPALLNAINAIRQNADTTNFPLAAIVTKNGYPTIYYGLGLFDWVGMDDYSNDVSTYMSEFAAFEGFANSLNVVGGTPQHFVLVPLVSSGVGTTYINGAPYMQSKFLTDNSVIGIMPFMWDATAIGGVGMVGEPWAPSYISLGQSIVPVKSSAQITVIVDLLVAH